MSKPGNNKKERKKERKKRKKQRQTEVNQQKSRKKTTRKTKIFNIYIDRLDRIKLNISGFFNKFEFSFCHNIFIFYWIYLLPLCWDHVICMFQEYVKGVVDYWTLNIEQTTSFIGTSCSLPGHYGGSIQLSCWSLAVLAQKLSNWGWSKGVGVHKI